MIKHGNFSTLAKQYNDRPSYSKTCLSVIIDTIQKTDIKFADVGAGTGKLTEVLIELGLNGVAVEPNDNMREEGKQNCPTIDWFNGSGENTTLENNEYDWVLMASSFHWTDPNQSLPEFHRLLKDNGTLTVLWNPRDIQRSELHTTIENKIYEMVPNMKRVSSGLTRNTNELEAILISTGHFKDVFMVEANHEEVMTPERYMNVWNSVNDIQYQSGDKWNDVLTMIETEISGMDAINVPYKTRSWSCTKV